MISYAVVDRIEAEYAVLELEMIPYEESMPDDFEKQTEMVDVEVTLLKENIKEEIFEGDVLLVLHDDLIVDFVLAKADWEKKARIKLLKELMQKMHE